MRISKSRDSLHIRQDGLRNTRMLDSGYQFTSLGFNVPEYEVRLKPDIIRRQIARGSMERVVIPFKPTLSIEEMTDRSNPIAKSFGSQDRTSRGVIRLLLHRKFGRNLISC
eukprot:TRINITY_DN3473_c0_g1_i3.p1 TRINITY_DN3473_c0_g1~~TRINITY_DN3473_c0_g1_i3.p1  ORF type:complete len:111 (-),score=4.05 TRINITY_DN3473_c0_g1_i3:391-723(-)